jgi:hypothetical protein
MQHHPLTRKGQAAYLRTCIHAWLYSIKPSDANCNIHDKQLFDTYFEVNRVNGEYYALKSRYENDWNMLMVIYAWMHKRWPPWMSKMQIAMFNARIESEPRYFEKDYPILVLIVIFLFMCIYKY